MESVGNQLRDARTQLGLSLEQVNSLTRISLRNLESIERDDLSVIASPFFYRSFVKQYAEVLKLNYDELVPAMQQAMTQLPEPLVPGQGHSPVPSRAMTPSSHRRRNWRWFISIASLVVVLAACSGFYALWQTARATAHNPAERLIPTGWSGSVRKAPSVDTPTSAAPSSDRFSAVPSANAPARTPPKGSFRIEISAIERSWLSVTADGKTAFTGVLRPKQTKILEEHDTARIKTGNAGGLSCVFNGKVIGRLGPRGQARTVVFTRNTYEVIRPAVHLAFFDIKSMFNSTGE